MSEESKAERFTGTVRFFDIDKGYGFCRRTGELPDVFVHSSALKRSGIFDAVRAGDTLEFDVLPVEGKGPKASSIRVVERAVPRDRTD